MSLPVIDIPHVVASPSVDVNFFIQDSAIDGLAVLDLKNFNLIWANKALLKRLGFPNDLMGFKGAYGSKFNSDLKFKLKNASPLLFVDKYKNVQKFRINSFSSEEYLLIGFEVIEESQERGQIMRYEHILKGTSIGLWEWNVQTKEVRFSEEWAKVLGYTLEELTPYSEKLWETLCHPDDFISCDRLFKDHFNGKTAFYKSEARMRHKNGSWIWVKDQGQVVTWKDGKPEWMTGFHKEITKDKVDAQIKRTFIDKAPSAIAMFDTQLNYLAVSEKWLEDYGISEDIIGKNHYEIFDIPDHWKEIHKRCLAGEIHQKEEDCFIDRSGQASFLRWHVKPWYNNGVVGGLLIQTTDLTPLKKMESAQLQQRKFQDAVFDAINVGIVTSNANGDITYYNKAFQNWHALPSAKCPTDRWPEYFKLYLRDGKTPLPKEDIPLFKILKGNVLNTNEVFVIKTAEKFRFVRAVGSQLFDADNQLYGALMAVHDVTQEVEAQKRIRLSEETFRRSFENAPIGIALVSTEGKWLRINEQISKILGFTFKELKAMTFQDITHPDDLEKDLRCVDELLQGEKESYQIEKRYFHKNGNIISAILSVSIVRGEKGKPLFFVSQITDVTELQRKKSTLKHLLNITKNQNSRLKNFAHIVSHNLRSHSSNFKMLVNLLEEDIPENQITTLLHSAADQLTETISHLNEVTALNTTEQRLMTPIVLKDYLDSTLDNLNAFIAESGVDIIDDTAPGTIIYGIPAYIESILLNFTTNAIKYRSTERKPYLRFFTVKLQNRIMLGIEDNGIGINLNLHGNKIFGMYKTFHNHLESRGIGLFIAKNQIEAMGGSVSVESTEGQGTTFKIYFKYEKSS